MIFCLKSGALHLPNFLQLEPQLIQKWVFQIFLIKFNLVEPTEMGLSLSKQYLRQLSCMIILSPIPPQKINGSSKFLARRKMS